MAFEVAGATREEQQREEIAHQAAWLLQFARDAAALAGCARVVFLARVWSSSSSSSFSFSGGGRHNGAGKAAQFGGAARIMQLGVHRGHAGCLSAPARCRESERAQ